MKPLLSFRSPYFSIFLFLFASIGMNCVWAQVPNTEPLKKGIYYIVSSDGEAIEPLSESPGNNVFLKKFQKSGLQKWEVIPQKNGSYFIKLMESELYLEPHPVGDRTAWLDSSKGGYTISAAKNTTDKWIVKSKSRKGDAMKPLRIQHGMTEVRFAPLDDSKNFQWEFILVQ